MGCQHRNLFAGELTGNTSHLFADVVATISVLERLQLHLEVGSLLPTESGGPGCNPNGAVT
jgi:hypothetical protein